MTAQIPGCRVKPVQRTFSSNCGTFQTSNITDWPPPSPPLFCPDTPSPSSPPCSTWFVPTTLSDTESPTTTCCPRTSGSSWWCRRSRSSSSPWSTRVGRSPELPCRFWMGLHPRQQWGNRWEKLISAFFLSHHGNQDYAYHFITYNWELTAFFFFPVSRAGKPVCELSLQNSQRRGVKNSSICLKVDPVTSTLSCLFLWN